VIQLTTIDLDMNSEKMFLNIASEEVRGRTSDALLRELDFNPETVIVLMTETCPIR